MSYELDMSQYIGLFLQEAREQLEVLEAETLKLETDPSVERLQVIFRAAHTLKGSARAMGFTHMAELTHEMENVLDNLRNGVIQMEARIADSLLSCQDFLAQMIDSIEAGTGDQVECDLLVRQLQGFVGGTSATTQTDSSGGDQAVQDTASGFESKLTEEDIQLLTEASADSKLFHAKFRLVADCAMKWVRAFMAISAVQETGELLVAKPSLEALEEEQFELEFELVFQSPELQENLAKKLSEISEMEWSHVGPWTAATEDSSSPQAETKPQAEASNVVDATAAIVAKEETAAAPTAPAGPVKKLETGQTVRVDVTRLDNLMNLVGELVIDRTRIAQIGSDLGTKFGDHHIEALTETVSHIHRITSDLQDQIMKARMTPIETVFNRFPRVVRDLAQKLGKDVKLEITGGETELDRSVIEVIGDPLLHILRNSIDHGLEMPDERVKRGKPTSGSVWLSAKHQENHIVIEIVDDGNGIDVERVKSKAIQSGLLTKDAADRLTDKEALQLIFASGLSTAQEVSEVSGRGVGMDIVRSNIQKLGGIIDLESTLGQGTKFSLRLPLTLAIIRGLLVELNSNVYVVPLGSVIETLLVDEKQIERVNGRQVIVIRGLTTPFIDLNNVLESAKSPNETRLGGQRYVVVVGLAEQRVGLAVDKLIGEREVVIKSLSQFCGEIPGISGATILGDGNVALILDVNGLVDKNRNS